MAVSYISPRIYATTDDGAPAVGYKLYTYLTGTSTPATTYSDAGGLSANTNPVILNARGEAVVFLTSGTTYRFVLKTDADVPRWTQDSIVGATSSVLSSNVTVSGAAVVPDGPLNDVLDDNETRISTLETDVANLESSATPVQGAFKSLSMSSTGLSALVSIACDQIVLKSTSALKTYSSVSLSLSTAATGLGGLDTGTISGSTWYAVWIIGKSDGTVGGILSTSATSPTMPTGYDFKARVGWIRTDGTASKYPLSFVQYGRTAQYKIVAGSNVTAFPVIASGTAGSTTVPTWTTASISNYVPSTASKIKVSMSAGNNYAMVAPNSAYAARTAASGGFTNGYNLNGAISYEFCLESTNVSWASDGSTCSLGCVGWEDNL